MSLDILGLATATPALSIPQEDAATEAYQLCCENEQQQRLLSTLYRRSGVKKRFSVILEGSECQTPDESPKSLSVENHGLVKSPELQVAMPSVTQSFFRPWYGGDDCGPTTTERMQMYEEYAPQLAKQAVMNALQNSQLDPEEITHLVTVSCTGFSAPGVDLSLIRECGLQPSVTRTHVGFMGCHGAINGLRVAQAYAEADPTACVLLCAVELCSLHQQYGWNRDTLVSNALFADGAAALIGRADSKGKSSSQKLRATASAVIAETEEMMGWKIRDNGFQMHLSPEVPDVIQTHLRNWLSDWLASLGLQIEDVGSWAVHPGGPRILTACQEALQLDDSALQTSLSILSEFGNMSSPTVLFILQRIMQQNSKFPCVALAFGPGLSIEAALIE